MLPLDDSGMVRVYGRENATQRGVMSSAVAGTVAAALRLVLKQSSGCSDEEIDADNFISVADLARGRSRDGVGRPAIMDVIGRVPGMPSAVAGTVAAALRLVLKNASGCSDEESSPGNFTSSSHGGSKLGDKSVGRPAIMDIIGHVPGMNDSKVKEQLAILKSSGDYRRIVPEEAAAATRIREDLDHTSVLPVTTARWRSATRSWS